MILLIKYLLFSQLQCQNIMYHFINILRSTIMWNLTIQFLIVVYKIDYVTVMSSSSSPATVSSVTACLSWNADTSLECWNMIITRAERGLVYSTIQYSTIQYRQYTYKRVAYLGKELDCTAKMSILDLLISWSFDRMTVDCRYRSWVTINWYFPKYEYLLYIDLIRGEV